MQSFTTNFDDLTQVTYETREALRLAVKERALTYGFCTAIKNSRPGANVYLKCDFGGEYRDRTNAPGSQELD